MSCTRAISKPATVKARDNEKTKIKKQKKGDCKK